MNSVQVERLFRALVICIASICGAMLFMIPAWVTYGLGAGCLLCVVFCVWQIVQPDAWIQKRLEDDASFARRHRFVIIVFTAIEVIVMIALGVFELIKNK